MHNHGENTQCPRVRCYSATTGKSWASALSIQIPGTWYRLCNPELSPKPGDGRWHLFGSSVSVCHSNCNTVSKANSCAGVALTVTNCTKTVYHWDDLGGQIRALLYHKTLTPTVSVGNGIVSQGNPHVPVHSKTAQISFKLGDGFRTFYKLHGIAM